MNVLRIFGGAEEIQGADVARPVQGFSTLQQDTALNLHIHAAARCKLGTFIYWLLNA
jgi:hypothetical protein